MPDESMSAPRSRQRLAVLLVIVTVAVVITAAALLNGGSHGGVGGAAGEASSSSGRVPASTGAPIATRVASSSTAGSSMAKPSAAATTASRDGGVGGLIGPKWYLQSVTENGRTWRPLTERASTLSFGSSTSATTEDGANEESWTVVLDGQSSVWTAGMSTLVGEDAASRQVGLALDGVLGHHPTWRLDDGTLQWTATDGSMLAYSRTALPAVAYPSGISAYLDLDPAGGTIAPGSELHLGQGSVTVRDARGAVVVHVQVTKTDMGLSVLPPGEYDVSAVSPGRTCRSQHVTVGKVGVLEVGLVCLSGH